MSLRLYKNKAAVLDLGLVFRHFHSTADAGYGGVGSTQAIRHESPLPAYAEVIEIAIQCCVNPLQRGRGR